MSVNNYGKMVSYTNGHDQEESMIVEDNKFKGMDLVGLAMELGKVQRR